jgi:hypothetical protein
MISVIFLTLSIVLNLVLGFMVWNAARRVDIYDQFCDSLLFQVKSILESMHSIDIRGAFEHDDEVGLVFKALKGLVENLEQFIPEENHGS